MPEDDEQEIDEGRAFLKSLREKAEEREKDWESEAKRDRQDKSPERSGDQSPKSVPAGRDVPHKDRDLVSVWSSKVRDPEALEKLRFLENVEEKMQQDKIDHMKKALLSVSEEIQVLVERLWTESNCLYTPEEAYERLVEALLDEMRKMGLLFPEVTGVYSIEFMERICMFIEDLPSGEGATRTQILVSLGRNSPRYYEEADYFLKRLCNEGVIEKRNKKYYKKE